MKTEYEKIIKDHDKTLSMLREEWMAAQGKEKNKWMQRINEILEERFRLMQLRDV